MMADKLRKLGVETDLSHLGGGEAPDVVSGIKRDMEGWREVLIPIASVLRWDQPYHPVILLGTTTFFFALIWFCEVSALTTISMFGLVLGLLDFGVPYFGPSVTGFRNWTAEEEFKFSKICENIASFKNDVSDIWQGLFTMRQDNSKVFFIIVMGALSFTAWIGNLVNNLLLTYLVVSFCLCLPGLQQNETTRVYLLRGTNLLRKVRTMLIKPKEQ